MAYKRQSPAPIVEGYTNAISMANTFGTAYFDGSKVNTVNPGTAIQILKSNGAGMAPTFQSSSGGSGISVIGFTSQNTSSSTPGGSAKYLSTTAGNAYRAPFCFTIVGSDSASNNIGISPVTGTFSNMYVYIYQNLSSTSTTYTLVVNSVNTSLAVTVAGGATGLFSDITDTASITAGQTVQLLCQQSTTGNVFGNVAIQFS